MENQESNVNQTPEDSAAPGQPSPQTGAQARKDSSAGRELYQNVRVLVTMMALFVLLFTFVARVIVVSGPSMQNTLFGGDLVLVWSLGYTPKQGDVVVPEDCIFVMGDNRNNSADSRLPQIGIVDNRCVIGRGVMVIFPFPHWRGL